MTAPTPATTGELLPCPWCGPGTALGSCDFDGEHWAVICNDCMAGGPAFDAEADAIAAWNRRASTPPPVADAGAMAFERAVDALIATTRPLAPASMDDVTAARTAVLRMYAEACERGRAGALADVDAAFEAVDAHIGQTDGIYWMPARFDDGTYVVEADSGDQFGDLHAATPTAAILAAAAALTPADDAGAGGGV